MAAMIVRQWQWDLRSAPEALWPFVADTNRFNRDVGLSPLVRPAPGESARLLATSVMGVRIEWEEAPFEWVWPQKYAVLRRYRGGPVAQMRMNVSMEPVSSGGTHLHVRIEAEPRGIAGRALALVQLHLTGRAMNRVYPRYDQLAQAADAFSALDPAQPRFAEGGRERLDAQCRDLTGAGGDATSAAALRKLIETGHDFALARVRPYALADALQLDRRRMLETFLMATRAGIMEFRWNVLCPYCRGPSQQATSMRELGGHSHCASCNVDFEVNFARSTELTFRPAGSIRPVETIEYCIGGPQLTPHIVAQQTIRAGESAVLQTQLEPGCYRVRTDQLRGGRHFRVTADAEASDPLQLIASDAGWPADEPDSAQRSGLLLKNETAVPQLFMVERLSWSDQAATAAEVTALQKFRDLFSSESLRPGEQVSVGSLAMLFTDLKSSTQMYRRLGDAPAFGRVMSHFDVVRQCIADESGAMVKTIGDAVMAVFPQPISAIRAMLKAQRILANPPHGQLPLVLKVGIHFGPCIAVTLNERLDYFGTTVNVASRLVELSSGKDLVLSKPVRDDPVVARHIQNANGALTEDRLEVTVKGVDEALVVYRLSYDRADPCPT